MFAILLTEGMNPFYQNISSFPTVFFTFFLGVSVLFWLVAVLGFVDIEILDFDMPGAASELGVNSDSGSDSPEVLAGLMLKFGLQGVPVTVIISLISLLGWLLCYYAAHFLLSWIAPGILRFVAGIPLILAVLYASVMITAIVIKPLRPFFQKAQQQTLKRVLGQIAVVRSSVVDQTFGEAVLEDGGAGLILKVRAGAGTTFKQGDRVVLLEYFPAASTYRVISESEFNGDSQTPNSTQNSNQ
jgi:hypothetical protein